MASPFDYIGKKPPTSPPALGYIGKQRAGQGAVLPGQEQRSPLPSAISSIPWRGQKVPLPAGLPAGPPQQPPLKILPGVMNPVRNTEKPDIVNPPMQSSTKQPGVNPWVNPVRAKPGVNPDQAKPQVQPPAGQLPGLGELQQLFNPSTPGAPAARTPTPAPAAGVDRFYSQRAALEQAKRPPGTLDSLNYAGFTRARSLLEQSKAGKQLTPDDQRFLYQMQAFVNSQPPAQPPSAPAADATAVQRRDYQQALNMQRIGERLRQLPFDQANADPDAFNKYTPPGMPVDQGRKAAIAARLAQAKANPPQLWYGR